MEEKNKIVKAKRTYTKISQRQREKRIIETAIRQYRVSDSEIDQYETKKYIRQVFGETKKTGEIIALLKEARRNYLLEQGIEEPQKRR